MPSGDQRPSSEQAQDRYSDENIEKARQLGVPVTGDVRGAAEAAARREAEGPTMTERAAEKIHDAATTVRDKVVEGAQQIGQQIGLTSEQPRKE